MDYLQELTDIVAEFNSRSEVYYRARVYNITCPRTINDSVEGGSSSLLSKCAMYGYADLVQRCIKLGSNLEESDFYNRTALCWALVENHTDTAEVLLKAGANLAL